MMRDKTLVKINKQAVGAFDLPFDPKHPRDKDLGKKKITKTLLELIEKSPELKKQLAGKEISSVKFAVVPKRELSIITKK